MEKVGDMQVEKLGRLMIPKKVRERMGWTAKTPIAFFVEESAGEIIMKQYGGTLCSKDEEETDKVSGLRCISRQDDTDKPTEPKTDGGPSGSQAV